MKKQTLSLSLLMSLSACTPQGYEAASFIADKTTRDISCKSVQMEANFWDGLKEYLLQEKDVIQAQTLKSVFAQAFANLKSKNPNLGSSEIQNLQSQMDTLIELILVEAPAGERVTTPEELLILVSALDVGDRSTPFRDYLQTKIRTQFSTLQKSIKTLNVECDGSHSAGSLLPEIPSSESNPGSSSGSGSVSGEESTPNESVTDVLIKRDYEYHKAQAAQLGLSAAAFGGRWTVATAYQSCQSVILPAMNAQSPSVQGIEVTGKHSDGVGNKRGIASLSKVVGSHYYIKDRGALGEGCFDLKKQPLIYDYGGKPYGTTSSRSTIDLFKNNGSGTSVLGIDCSAFVYTSLASVGLRLKAGRNLKASDSWAWGSTSYVDPQKNGLTCLNKIPVSPKEQLRSGDIIAVRGHVLMVDQVGSDPFGIKNARTISDCGSLSARRFNFVVSQSSPSKSAIGINIYEAKDYVPTSSKIRSGLEKYAYYACLAKFENKTYTPTLGTLSVVRHNGTKECMSARVSLNRESCISSCGTLAR